MEVERVQPVASQSIPESRKETTGGGRVQPVASLSTPESKRETIGVERVQAIASLSIPAESIPVEFIRPETEQPGITTYHGPVPEIPTIDLSDPDQKKLVRLISDASREWGFFEIVNHGIPSEVFEKLQKVGKEFFELPQEKKEAVARKPESSSSEGYGTNLTKGDEKKSWVDFLFHNIWPASSINYQFWPKNPPAYREANEDYAQHLKGVVDKLLTILSEGIGLEGNVLKDAVGGEELEYLLKINCYPPCARPDLILGVPAHTDMSALTVLVPNDVPGLQVFKDDRWFDAKYIPNALVIHIGDQLEILSNGKYKSVLHRTTVNKEMTRMSWPVFCSPPAEMVIGPLPQLVNEDNPAKYKTKKYKDYQYCKLNKLPQ
ncbi:flavonol synthase/flavanone 3-hydroxylase-like [Macadamia integrifolia]|uniref:flavonol synthase/flavanone 3-hydroxylase-like n=1 Tax=Macadamia integrifolia TaxID=60698 RepID=UPI001C4EF146|nr:flavonol synthase/flavanone 3-hydroxylase-like [Macadamia integrifolia]